MLWECNFYQKGMFEAPNGPVLSYKLLAKSSRPSKVSFSTCLCTRLWLILLFCRSIMWKHMELSHLPSYKYYGPVSSFHHTVSVPYNPFQLANLKNMAHSALFTFFPSSSILAFGWELDSTTHKRSLFPRN